HFNQVAYTITANATTGGTTSGSGSYGCGSTATVTATASSGYGFVNWTENGTVVSTSASYSFTVSANRTLLATFTSTACHIQWKKLTGGPLQVIVQVGADFTIYAGANDNKLWAVKPDGSTKWTYLTGRAVKTRPSIS